MSTQIWSASHSTAQCCQWDTKPAGTVGKETLGPTAQTFSRGLGSAAGLKDWTPILPQHGGKK